MAALLLVLEQLLQLCVGWAAAEWQASLLGAGPRKYTACKGHPFEYIRCISPVLQVDLGAEQGPLGGRAYGRMENTAHGEHCSAPRQGAWPGV